MKYLKTILALSLIIVSISCTNDPKKELIGKWAEVENGIPILEFLTENIVEITSGPSLEECITLRAVYEFPAEDSIKIINEIQIQYNIEPSADKYYFKRGKLIFITQEGKTHIYKRVN
ncbi:hypothetical protein K8R42_00760 [bacterium]|nr:hypothetical protein [bacterium]